ncbi:MAG: hypothetical protein ACT4OM_04035 [Actinomycetota bacterium]
MARSTNLPRRGRCAARLIATALVLCGAGGAAGPAAGSAGPTAGPAAGSAGPTAGPAAGSATEPFTEPAAGSATEPFTEPAGGEEGYARDLVDQGFNLSSLIALAGSGPDPGPEDPNARLSWAIATAVPAPWSRKVPVFWGIAPINSLALSFPDGRVIVSPEALDRSGERLLSAVAHEMGHQLAIALVPDGDGTPPRGFINLLPGIPYNRFDEGWADCVSRVWTGSLLHTAAEPRPCPTGTARYVATVLADPGNFLEPSPAPTTSPGPEALPLASPSVARPSEEKEVRGIGYRPLVLVVLVGLVWLAARRVRRADPRRPR